MKKQAKRPIGIKNIRRLKRKLHVRKKVVGTTERPRLCAVRSNKHLSVLLADDDQNKVLFSITPYGKNSSVKDIPNNEVGAKKLAEVTVAKLKELKVNEVIFDRNGKKFGKVLDAFVSGVRETGIKI